MEKYEEARDKYKKCIIVADHMLTVTYSIVRDAKLLLAVIENIFLAYTNAMGSLLHQELLLKNIAPFNDRFEDKLRVFRESCVDKYDFNKKFLIDMQNIKDIIVEHKKSPVEFSRRGQFVICSDSYNIRTITSKEIGEYINKAKIFIEAIDNIIEQNERTLRRL